MNAQRGSRIALAGFFDLAGVAHFAVDTEFAKIIPPFFPMALQIAWLTGLLMPRGAQCITSVP